MISPKQVQLSGDQALCIEIDEMRLTPHPVKEWEKQYWHGAVRMIQKYMKPSPALMKEALAELDALGKAMPAKPYQRRVSVAAGAAAVVGE